jgi:hypothetical protein
VYVSNAICLCPAAGYHMLQRVNFETDLAETCRWSFVCYKPQLSDTESPNCIHHLHASLAWCSKDVLFLVKQIHVLDLWLCRSEVDMLLYSAAVCCRRHNVSLLAYSPLAGATTGCKIWVC